MYDDISHLHPMGSKAIISYLISVPFLRWWT